MAFRRNLLTMLLLLMLLAVQVYTEEECSDPNSIAEFTNTVIDAVCSMNDTTGESFRNQTRFSHGAGHKQDSNNFYAISPLFSVFPSAAMCFSVCAGIDRANVKWCIRIADADRNIETCISLNETREVFTSTCDAKPLELERHLSLPTLDLHLSFDPQSEECNRLYTGSGCLALTNIAWSFKDAYLTCFSANDSCSDTTFTLLYTFTTSNKLRINEHTESPLWVQPSDQIIVFAEATITTPYVSATWHHGNTTYSFPINEDPFCPECYIDTYPYAEVLKKQRIRFYMLVRTSSIQCQGTIEYSLTTYLIIDNATSADAGTYVVTVTTGSHSPISVQENITVVIECESTTLIKTSCNTNSTIILAKGANTMWTCMLQGPPSANFSIRHNKTLLPLPSKLTGKECPDTLSDKEPHVRYQVEEDEKHECYTSFTVHVVVCAVEEGVEGDYSIVWDNQSIIEGSTVSVKLSTQESESEGSQTGYTVAAVTGGVLAVVIISLTVVIVVMILIWDTVARRRKRQVHGLTPQSLNRPAVKASMNLYV